MVITTGNDAVEILETFPDGCSGIGVYVRSSSAVLLLGYIGVDASVTRPSALGGGLGVNNYGFSSIPYDWVLCSDNRVQIYVSSYATGSSSPPTTNTTNIADVAVTTSAASTGLSTGAGGSTYTYWNCPLTANGGLIRPLSSTSITDVTGAMSYSNNAYINLAWTPQLFPGYAIYGDSSNPSNSQVLLAITPLANWQDMGYGPVANQDSGVPPYLPSTLPVASIAPPLLAFVCHDDTFAWEAWLSEMGGVPNKLRIPVGRFYSRGLLIPGGRLHWYLRGTATKTRGSAHCLVFLAHISTPVTRTA